VHHDDASDVAPIHVVRAVADHSTLVGHEMNRGEGSELHEGHVLCEVLTGEVSKRYTHGIARAEVERGRTHAHGRPRWPGGYYFPVVIEVTLLQSCPLAYPYQLGIILFIWAG
jgi:hypothetical protein